MPVPHPVESKTRRGFVGTALVSLAALFTRSQDAGAAPTPKAPGQRNRRVITGVDAQGRSRIDSDAPPPPNAVWNDDGARGMDFWGIRQVPAPMDGALEPTADWELANRAPPGGLFGRLMTWPPGFEIHSHTTPTVDLGVIVSGRLELVLDTGSTILNPGDMIVQRGTAHGWRVVGPEPCTWVVVMVDAKART